MINYELQERLLGVSHRQSLIDDGLLSSKESLQQYLAHIISENQYRQQQLKDSKETEKKLIDENLRLKTE